MGADGSGNVLQREIDPSGNFSPRGSLSRAISSSQSGRRNSDNKESVGATLWDTDISGGMKLAVETLKNDSELVISAEAAPSGKPTLSPIVQAEPMEDMRREADPVPAGKPAATAETTSSFGGTRVPASAPGEAAGERDLFQRISFRYRTTELFRMQKAGEIPDSPSSFAKR